MSQNTYFTKILDDSTQLTTVLAKARHLKRLNEVFQSLVPVQYRPYCCVANVTAQTLVVLTVSPAWRHQLSYSLPQILAQLRRFPEYQRVRHIKCRVSQWQAPLPEMTPPAAPTFQLSTTTRTLLEETALHVDSRRLRRSLQRLARYQVKPSCSKVQEI